MQTISIIISLIDQCIITSVLYKKLFNYCYRRESLSFKPYKLEKIKKLIYIKLLNT